MITSIERYKSVTGMAVEDTSQDERIGALIPLVEEWIKGYTGEIFPVVEGKTVYPAGYELTAIGLIEYNMNFRAGKKSESLGSYSVSFENEYPERLIAGLRKVRPKVRFF